MYYDEQKTVTPKIRQNFFLNCASVTLDFLQIGIRSSPLSHATGETHFYYKAWHYEVHFLKIYQQNKIAKTAVIIHSICPTNSLAICLKEVHKPYNRCNITMLTLKLARALMDHCVQNKERHVEATTAMAAGIEQATKIQACMCRWHHRSTWGVCGTRKVLTSTSPWLSLFRIQ